MYIKKIPISEHPVHPHVISKEGIGMEAEISQQVLTQKHK